MKLPILIAGILAIAIPSIASAQGFETNLIYGMRANTDVRELQDFLKDQGFFRGPITGNYFSLTRSAVIRFQIKNGVKPANGQFTTTTREIAQKMIDPEQDVQEMPTTTSYLDYPIGTYLLPSSSTTYPVLDGSTSNLQPSNPTIIYYPVYVPQNEPIVGSNEIQVVQTSSPVVEAPKDTTPANYVYHNYTTAFGNGNTSIGWNSTDNCSNCIVVVTDEPTTIKLEYIPYDTNSFNQFNSYLDQVSTWNDNGKLSNVHIFMMKGRFEEYPKVYTYRISVKDIAGNETKDTIDSGYWSGRKVALYPNSNSVTNINGVQTIY